jgi:hypothetical protein
VRDGIWAGKKVPARPEIINTKRIRTLKNEYLGSVRGSVRHLPGWFGRLQFPCGDFLGNEMLDMPISGIGFSKNPCSGFGEIPRAASVFSADFFRGWPFW